METEAVSRAAPLRTTRSLPTRSLNPLRRRIASSFRAVAQLARSRCPTPRRSSKFGHTADVLPELARGAVNDLLGRLDRVVPDRIEGFYVVGSASMGAFRAGRSDVDFVATVNGALGRTELARLRAVHLGRWTAALVHDVALRRRWPLVCNGIYLRAVDLSISPLAVIPLAGHVTGRFRVATREGFDVNPVTWHVLAHHGIAIRGPDVTDCRSAPTKPSYVRGRSPTSTTTGSAGSSARATAA